jgi:hypothetical protein
LGTLARNFSCHELEDVSKNVYFINENSHPMILDVDAMQSPLNDFMHMCVGII